MMHARNKPQRRRRIGRISRLARKHLLYITACSVFFTFIAVCVQLYSDYRDERAKLDDVFAMIENSYVPSITAGLFSFNQEQINLLLKGIVMLPDIVYAEVIEDHDDDSHIIDAVGREDIADPIKKVYPLIYIYKGDERDMGELRVYADVNNIYNRLRSGIDVIVLTTAIETFALAFFILVIVQLLTVRPLKKIVHFLSNINPSDVYDERLLSVGKNDRGKDQARKKDEIDEIADAVNSMLQRLRRNYMEMQESQEHLKNSLQEKETLLRELYHRTKNNMQVIQSILALQASRLPENSGVQKLVKDTKNRIFSMSLVHQKLYQSQDLSRINVNEYISELINFIIDGYDDASKRISLTLDVENISMLLDTAIPCGLIVNELVSNSLQHAFPDGRKGDIFVGLRKKDRGPVVLTVADNGVGVPAGFDFRKQGNLGLQTVVLIAENQMQGNIDFEGKQGARWTIEFPCTLYSERV